MKKKGFTLIELLIVIAIIAILATIIIIALANTRPKAYRATAIESLTQAIKGANACIASSDTLSVINNVAPPANKVICTASATSAAATGVWPTLPTGYTYTVTSTATSLTAVTVTTDPDGPQANFSFTCPTKNNMVTGCEIP